MRAAIPPGLLAALAVAACNHDLKDSDFKASTAAAAAARTIEFRLCKFGLDLSNPQDRPQLVLCMENRGYEYEPRGPAAHSRTATGVVKN